MAGLGRRTFAAGEVLTASNVMGYLQDQAVMKFANAAARGSAIGTAVISEGMVSYLSDADAVQVYDGSAWKPVGTVLQVVYGSTLSQASNSTTTFADTGLTATITPSSTSSKIIVLVSQSGLYKSPDNYLNSIWLQLLKNSTVLSIFGLAIGLNYTAQYAYPGEASTLYVDSPATTSATTYKTQFRNEVAAAEISVQRGGNGRSNIILIEVTA